MSGVVLLANTLGFALQLIPPIIIYFSCVPDSRLPASRGRVIRRFVIAMAVGCAFLGPAAYLLWSAIGYEHSMRIISALLLLAIAVLVAAAVRTVRMPLPFHLAILCIVVFYSSMHFIGLNVVSVTLFHGGLLAGDEFDLIASALMILLFLPPILWIYPRYTRAFLENPISGEILTTFRATMALTIIALAHVLLEAWNGVWIERYPVLNMFLPSVIMMVVHWLFLRFVVIWDKHNRLERSLLESRVELMESRMHLLSSQIQPHFIHNTMNAIYNLCDEDVEDAKQAICDFSDYLRINFEAMDTTAPVPFQKELEHARFYLSIEKRRFRDKLNVVYDIQATGFTLPVLTVQPLVENAVRHGLRQKTTPGTLILRSRETETHYEIVIQDDGAGFDVNADPGESDDRKHLGIANTRARLEKLFGGALEIESEPGRGTTVTVRIPKEVRPL